MAVNEKIRIKIKGYEHATVECCCCKDCRSCKEKRFQRIRTDSAPDRQGDHHNPACNS